MFESEYKQWLERAGYQQTTIYASISSTRAAEALWSKNPQTDMKLYTYLLRRYARFLKETKHESPTESFEAWLLDHYAAARAGRQGTTRKPCLSPADFDRLKESLKSSDDIVDDILLFLLEYPAIEPRNLLRMPARKLSRVCSPEIGSVLRKLGVENLGKAICDAGPDCAFKRVQRRLKHHAEKLALEVDFRSLARARKPTAATEPAFVV